MAENRQNPVHQSPVTVGQFLKVGRNRLNLELAAGEAGLGRVIIEPMIHRPGLALSGYFKHFAKKRIQVLGMVENAYLSSLQEGLRVQRFEEVFAQKIPCMIFTRGKRVFPEVFRMAERDGVAVLRTGMVTRDFIHAATFVLEDLRAPRCKVHGTMLEVAGVGVLIEGAPGLGKSETALGLIKRGHALVADDLTQLRRDSNNFLLGSAIPVTQYYMEIRGDRHYSCAVDFWYRGGAWRKAAVFGCDLETAGRGRCRTGPHGRGGNVSQVSRDFCASIGDLCRSGQGLGKLGGNGGARAQNASFRICRGS